MQRHALELDQQARARKMAPSSRISGSGMSIGAAMDKEAAGAGAGHVRTPLLPSKCQNGVFTR